MTSFLFTESLRLKEIPILQRKWKYSQRPKLFVFFLFCLPFLPVKLNNKGPAPGQEKLFVRLGKQKEQ